jgi:Uma2 family endonuclease
MIATPIQSLTEFLARQDIDTSPALELLENGVQRKLMPTFEHSELQLNLVNAIRAASGKYKAYQEIRCNVGGLSLVPDVLVIPTGQASGHFSGAPVWVIEIRSPGQSTTELTTKIIHCLNNGTVLGWLIDIQRSRIMVWQNDELDVYQGLDVPPALEILALNVDEILALQY